MVNAIDKDIEIGISEIRRLIEVVKAKYDFDLGCFALTSFKRRIIKALKSNQLQSIDALTGKLISDESFFDKFLYDINVECTEFFRDPAFWRYFRDDMLPVVNKNQRRVKIWIPACSSCEELITTAITIREAGINDKTQLLATDISPLIIDKINERVYSNQKFEISETNYQRFNEEKTRFSIYTIPEQNGFRIRDDIYENIKFELYNFQKAEKTRGFNIIIARNIFIYYSSKYHEMLLRLFIENLNQNGYLVLGNMENISWCNDYYKLVEVNNSERVYKKAV